MIFKQFFLSKRKYGEKEHKESIIKLCSKKKKSYLFRSVFSVISSIYILHSLCTYWIFTTIWEDKVILIFLFLFLCGSDLRVS